MRFPRVRLTVRWLMVAVAVFAVDLGLIRWAGEPSNRKVLPSYDALGALSEVLAPSLSLLAVAAVNAGLGLARRGRASPFATGYLLCGSLAAFGVCLDFA